MVTTGSTEERVSLVSIQNEAVSLRPPLHSRVLNVMLCEGLVRVVSLHISCTFAVYCVKGLSEVSQAWVVLTVSVSMSGVSVAR